MELNDDIICDELIPILVGSEGWTALEATDRLKLVARPWKHTWLLRFDYSVGADFNLSCLPAIEEMKQDQLQFWGLGTKTKMDVHTVNNPGDAIISIQVDMEVQRLLKRQSLLLASTHTSSDIEAEYRNAVLMRCLQTSCNGRRIDIVAPVNPQTGLTMSQDGSRLAWFCLTTPTGPDLFSVSMAMLFHGRRYPVWLTKNLLHVMDVCAKLRQDRINQLGIKIREAHPASDVYTVLSLKSCARGYPLLPGASSTSFAERRGFAVTASVILGEECWEQIAPQGLNFQKWLQLFLFAIGICKFDVFDTLYGRKMMAWQAVVTRSSWQAIRVRFLSRWKIGRAAYRCLNQTRTAPTITEDAEPRCSDSICLKKKGQTGNSRASDPLYRIRNTFIDDFVGVENASDSDSEGTLSC